jgi:hypothetical protein
MASRTFVKGQSNKRMKLTIALASPHGTRRRGSACSPFGEHRALAAYPRCSADLVEFTS